MKISRKTMAAIIALVLTLTITSTFTLPPVTAHDPAWTLHSWCYIDASPDPVGVGQQVLLVFWGDYYPATASGQYGDRYTFNIEITKPDNSKQTLGPITSDPVGGGWTTFTPDQVGTYTFVAKMDGVVFGTTGIYPDYIPIEDFNRYAYFGDIMEPSTSEPATLTVQQDQLTQLPAAELPTGYWDRPIYATNREWSAIAGSWLGDGQDNNNIYSTGPKTAHILWTKPTTFGGIVGEPFGQKSYHTGSAYESWARTSWSAGRPGSFIINGRLYYSEPQAPRYGWYCVDLRTGEELFWSNSTGPIQIGSQTGAHISSTNIPWMYPAIAFGQILEFDSGNQHGASAYVWSRYDDAEGSTYSYEMLNGTIYSFDARPGNDVWSMYDPFTGLWICNVANIPGGTRTRGPNGEILLYDLSDFELRIWNSTNAVNWPNNNLGVEFGEPGGGGSSEAYYWMLREPIGRTVDGRNGYNEETYTFDTAVGDPSISFIGNEIMLCTDQSDDTLYLYGYSMKPGEVGKLLWQEDLLIPYPVTASTSRNRWRMGPVSEDEGVFCMNMKEDLQWYGFSLNTGKQIWGPAPAEEAWQLYGMDGQIYEGMLYSSGYGGIYAYDVQTGQRLWHWAESGGLEDPYPNIGDWSMIVADGKIYAWGGEHSHTQPLFRSWVGSCIDAFSGETIWDLTGLWGGGMLADGLYVNYDFMDNQYYCFGKGQTATTVAAGPKTIAKGNNVIIEGTITDQSPGAKDTPAIADVDMSAWMEYIYRDRPMPTDATGVPVNIDAIDPNGNFITLGTTYSDMSGFYSLMWKPENEGKYTIMATMPGTDSYYASYAETAIGVGPASSPAGPIEPEPTEPTTGLITTEIAIIAAVIVASIIGIAAFWVLRKRK